MRHGIELLVLVVAGLVVAGCGGASDTRRAEPRDSGLDADTAAPADAAEVSDSGLDADAAAPADAAQMADATQPTPACPVGSRSAACPAGGSDAASTPIEYGICELDRARADVGSNSYVRVITVEDDPDVSRWLVETNVNLDERAESYAVVACDEGSLVVGRDAVGAMYGAFEVAERLRLHGLSVLPPSSPLTAAPAVAIRGANPFLVLPQPTETRWWFLDEGYWREYLDLLARARFNFLDLHGMFSLDNTAFPNALLYFATSATYPEIGGVPLADREQNLAMLNRIIQWASVRGIRVGLMTYQATTSPLGDGNDPFADPDAGLDSPKLAQYTREATADLVRRAPGLWRVGFRIGESNRPTAWYSDTLIAGVRDVSTTIGISTRTWGATKPDLLDLLETAGDDPLVEAKYNGEQWGPPYFVTGGPFTSIWSIYSYQDYLDPPTPYSFVLQLRACGTHRIFRAASYQRSRRTVESLALSPRIRGITFEPPHAYYPQRDYYHLDPADRFSEWTFRRDELGYLMLGRLAYDPAMSEGVFRAALAQRVGTDGLWSAVQAASDIVPWIQTARTYGVDHRQFAPELELGGDVSFWAGPWDMTATDPAVAPSNRGTTGYQGPFDTFAVASPYQAATDLAQGTATTRLSPVEVARIVLSNVDRARSAATVAVDANNAEARDVVRECMALADLGDYFGHKLRAATALAVYARSGREEWFVSAQAESVAATDAWQALARDTAYIAPFVDNLRMVWVDDAPFHWQDVVPRLADDARALDAVHASVSSSPPDFAGTLPAPSDWLAAARPAGPGLAALVVAPPDPAASSWTVAVTFAGPVAPNGLVNVLWKPFDSREDWRSVAATASGDRYVATVAGTGRGALFAVELIDPAGFGWRYPDVLQETPYRSLPP